MISIKICVGKAVGNLVVVLPQPQPHSFVHVIEQHDVTWQAAQRAATSAGAGALSGSRP